MNITKASIDLMRYVSTSGKRTVLETLPQNIKAGAKYRYAGHAEYKSIPFNMPTETKSLKYNQWEELVLKHGGTKSYALNGWFKIITPPEKRKLSLLEEEVTKGFSKDNINKIEFFKSLSQKERDYLSNYGINLHNNAELREMEPDNMQLFAVLTDRKPAWFNQGGFNGQIDFSKIKLNPNIADKFDVVKLHSGGLYFLNKNEVMKIIKDNKDVYCAELGVNSSENLGTIYNALLEYLPFHSSSRGHTLFGMTLGFPRHSSMIFELQGLLRNEESNIIDNVPLFKEKLLELLHSDKSPFQRYPTETIKRLEEHIKAMKSTYGVKTSISYFHAYGNEQKTIDKILKQSKDFEENFRVEDLM